MRFVGLVVLFVGRPVAFGDVGADVAASAAAFSVDEHRSSDGKRGPEQPAPPPLCTEALLHDVEGFMIDLDGTMYGDLSEKSRGINAFIDGAVAFHDSLLSSHTPYVYLSDSGCKGANGVDAKFRALGLAAGAGGANHSWTAAQGIAELLSEAAPPGAQILLLDSVSSFDGEIDSCLRVLQREVGEPMPWDVRVTLEEQEAKVWASLASRGEPLFVVHCLDGASSAPDGGPAAQPGFDAGLMTGAVWLLSNGATLVGSALDDFTFAANEDPAFPRLRLWLPGPGPWLTWLRKAGGLSKSDSSRFRVVGKGGNEGTTFMFDPALRLLRSQSKAARSLRPGSTAMVGDTLVTDMAGGQAFGAKTIFVSGSGLDHLEDLSRYPGLRPTCHVPNVGDLAELLRRRAPPATSAASASAAAGAAGAAAGFVTLYS